MKIPAMPEVNPEKPWEFKPLFEEFCQKYLYEVFLNAHPKARERQNEQA